MASAHAAYVAKSGPAYQTAYSALARDLRRTFPKAEAVHEYGFPGWMIPRPKGAPRPPREGTMPSDRLFIGLAKRKAGLTVYVWYPGDYDLFGKHRAALQGAGFKVMRGCLVYDRKKEFPADAVAGLLAAIKKTDAGGAASRSGSR